MAQVINTNVMSLNAQRNLTTSSSSLATSIQRLSSGMRINSAKDDAAGLAISERFTTQIRGLDVATRNANDGISLAQTAEGAMVEISNNLQRIRELAVQSANATNSDSDRKALDSEVKQLTAEIDRVARQTNFNGTALLDGTFAGKLFQVGADAGQTIGINSITNASTASLGGAVFDSNTLTAAAITGSGSGNGDIKVTGLQLKGADGKAVTIDTVEISAGTTAADTLKALQSGLMQAINAKMDQTGIMATAGTGNAITLSSIKHNVTASGTFNGISIAAAGTWSITGTGNTITPGTITTANTAATTAMNKFVAGVDISSELGSQQALSVVDKALTAVNSARADMGAIQNRFQSTIANLSATSENLSASRSRIRDTDYAKETAELTRTQILQQAGTAMLSQANSSTSNVLSLLG